MFHFIISAFIVTSMCTIVHRRDVGSGLQDSEMLALLQKKDREVVTLTSQLSQFEDEKK
jgi:hypothetical protein